MPNQERNRLVFRSEWGADTTNLAPPDVSGTLETIGQLLARNLGVTSFTASETPRPFHPFTVSWQIDGPTQSLRVLQGKFALLAPGQEFRGMSASDSVELWIPATSELSLAVEYTVSRVLNFATIGTPLTVETDDSACGIQTIPLSLIALQLQNEAQGVVEMLGQAHGVEVELLNAQATAVPFGINCILDVRIYRAGVTATARLQATIRLTAVAVSVHLFPELVPIIPSVNVELDGGPGPLEHVFGAICGVDIPTRHRIKNTLQFEFRRGIGRLARNQSNLLCRADNHRLAWAETREHEFAFRCCPMP